MVQGSADKDIFFSTPNSIRLSRSCIAMLRRGSSMGVFFEGGGPETFVNRSIFSILYSRVLGFLHDDSSGELGARLFLVLMVHLFTCFAARGSGIRQEEKGKRRSL